MLKYAVINHSKSNMTRPRPSRPTWKLHFVQVLREQAREKERLSRALRRMFEAEVSKRRTFARATLHIKAESEGMAAILNGDACEGLECRTDEVGLSFMRCNVSFSCIGYLRDGCMFLFRVHYRVDVDEIFWPAKYNDIHKMCVIDVDTDVLGTKYCLLLVKPTMSPVCQYLCACDSYGTLYFWTT